MKKILALILISSLLLIAPASAKSLWTNNSKSQFSDRKAINQGDIITIIIEESSMAQSSNSTQNGKSLEIGGESGAKSESEKTDKTIFNSIAKMIPLFGAAAKGSSDYKKQAQDSRKTALKTTISVVVEEIDENGNIKLRGERLVKINNADQKMVISGVCRTDDVSVDNTISSTKVANASIVFNGNVDFSDAKRKGFFAKAANGIWNFLF
ncbi:MAG TPA: flagellar basal body L-ring protein FlgH [bacterium]|nr:flagellar basal body L-ring protein FlgH [bacterium]HPN32707.1 flagellar basal body L-ring protein FlgH [bacterium]